MCVYIYIYIHIYIHTYIYIYVYIYIYIYRPGLRPPKGRRRHHEGRHPEVRACMFPCLGYLWFRYIAIYVRIYVPMFRYIATYRGSRTSRETLRPYVYYSECVSMC